MLNFIGSGWKYWLRMGDIILVERCDKSGSNAKPIWATYLGQLWDAITDTIVGEM